MPKFIYAYNMYGIKIMFQICNNINSCIDTLILKLKPNIILNVKINSIHIDYEISDYRSPNYIFYEVKFIFAEDANLNKKSCFAYLAEKKK